MEIQTLFMPWDSVHGVLAIRATLVTPDTVLVDDPVLPRQFPNNPQILAEAGYFSDPDQARQFHSGTSNEPAIPSQRD